MAWLRDYVLIIGLMFFRDGISRRVDPRTSARYAALRIPESVELDLSVGVDITRLTAYTASVELVLFP